MERSSMAAPAPAPAAPPSRGRKRRASPKAASASVIPLLLAAVLQPAGESVIAWSASDDVGMQGWESRGQCPAVMPARMSSPNPCGAGWETLACMHEGLAQSRVSRGALVQDDDDLRFDNQGDGGDERDGTETYSFREGYYLAILVRLGLILLEFGSRPLKNAKRILSCGIICFAIYHLQSPDAGKGLRPKKGSPKDMFAMSMGLRISGKGRGVPLSEGHEVMQPGRLSSDAKDVGFEQRGNTTNAEGVLGVDGAEEHAVGASNRGTLTFASIYLVSKLLNKLLCLTKLDKKHKKMRLIKLTKLAKIGKIAYNPLSKRSVKMAVKMCRYLKLLKLLKLSKKSKKLVDKRHWRKFKVLKALKLVKILQLMGVAYALS